MDHDWEALARRLDGSFSARTRGLVSPEVVLLEASGQTFGRLVVDRVGGGRVLLGDVSARIEAPTEGTYRMTTEDAELLAARESGPATDLELRSGTQAYEARISVLGNEAVARRLPGGTEAARVSGGLTNRRYGATFDPEDPASLPVAISLLDRLFTLRRSAFRTGG